MPLITSEFHFSLVSHTVQEVQSPHVSEACLLRNIYVLVKWMKQPKIACFFYVHLNFCLSPCQLVDLTRLIKYHVTKHVTYMHTTIKMTGYQLAYLLQQMSPPVTHFNSNNWSLPDGPLLLARLCGAVQVADGDMLSIVSQHYRQRAASPCRC